MYLEYMLLYFFYKNYLLLQNKGYQFHELHMLAASRFYCSCGDGPVVLVWLLTWAN